MSHTALRSSVVHAARAADRSYRKRGIDREHIFRAIFRAVSAGRGPEVRLTLLHRFSLIEKVVANARQGNLPEARRILGELAEDHERSGDDALPIDGLAPLYLPARALVEFKEGDHERAIRSLSASTESLARYFERGVDDAGVALIEQRFNIVRTLAELGDASRLEAATGEFLELVMDGTLAVAGEHRRLRGGDADARQILDHYFDEAMFKAFAYLRTDAIGRLLERVAAHGAGDDDLNGVRYAATICSALLPSGTAAAAATDVQADRLIDSAFSLLMLIDAVTSDGIAPGDGDDLRTLLRDHADYDRCSVSLSAHASSDVPATSRERHYLTLD